MLLDVIFLDIDGVLNPDKNERRDIFDPGCVQQLRRILEACPESRVVFSTTWRLGYSFFVLGWFWRHYDLPLNRAIARTPDIHLKKRGEEIQQWLTDAPRLAPNHTVRHYAVLDDEVEPILAVVPRQHVFTCDPLHGLTGEVADRVIRHLSGAKSAAKPSKTSKTA